MGALDWLERWLRPNCWMACTPACKAVRCHKHYRCIWPREQGSACRWKARKYWQRELPDTKWLQTWDPLLSQPDTQASGAEVVCNVPHQVSAGSVTLSALHGSSMVKCMRRRWLVTLHNTQSHKLVLE